MNKLRHLKQKSGQIKLSYKDNEKKGQPKFDSPLRVANNAENCYKVAVTCSVDPFFCMLNGQLRESRSHLPEFKIIGAGK